MKLKIFTDEGAIHGWAVALGETIMVFTLLALGFFIPSIGEAWKVMGSFVQTIYPLTFGSWLAYKTVTSFNIKL